MCNKLTIASGIFHCFVCIGISSRSLIDSDSLSALVESSFQNSCVGVSLAVIVFAAQLISCYLVAENVQ